MRASALAQSSPPRKVAEVTSTPCAGFSTASASGRVGSSQWRWRPISYSRPSTRSTASQSTKSGSAGPPIRAASAIQACKRLHPPGEAADRAFDPRAGLRVEPVGRVLEHRLEPLAERDQRPEQQLQRLDRRRRGLDQSRRRARPARSRARSRHPARWRGRRRCRAPRASSASTGPNGCALGEPLQPAVAGQRAAPSAPPRRAPARRPRHRRRRPSAARRARAAGRATCPPGPTIQRRSSIASCPVRRRRRSNRRRRTDDGPRRTRSGSARWPSSRPRAALTITSAWLAMTRSASWLARAARSMKHLPVMRAAGIDAFAAPVGQRGRAGAAEQGGQPARQVAADHVAVLAYRRPSARRAARGSRRGRRSRPAARPRG